MPQKDSRFNILLIIATVLIVGGIIAAVVATKSETSQESFEVPELKAEEISYDFGEVSMARGLVNHDFIIKNNGKRDLKISSIKTSCMCTTAVLELNSQRSPEFGMHSGPAFWSEELTSGEEAILEVTFDPNAHGPEATGPIKRSIIVYSNDGGRENSQTIFTFSAEVVK